MPPRGQQAPHFSAPEAVVDEEDHALVAGRVIRTTSDEGVVFLIDDRFRRAEVRRLLPAWWHVEMA